MIRLFCLFLLALMSCRPPLSSQSAFVLSKGAKQIDLPFEYVNGFIIVEVYLNAIFPYHFIFDTGAEHTILTRRDFMSFPGMYLERTFYLIGSDQSQVIPAHLIRNVRMDIPNKAASTKQDILMLEENVFAFEEYTGVKVDGILSASVFDDYVIRINYQRQVITLYQHGVFDSLKKPRAQRLEIEVTRKKPYLKTQIKLQGKPDSAPVKLLIDTGASTSLLLFMDSTILPPTNALSGKFAMGIGGDLEGYVGRLDQLFLGQYTQDQPITHYQTVDSLEYKTYLNNRNGLIGNQVWSRYIVDLDYRNQAMWLTPTKITQSPYQYDRTGLSIIAGGRRLNKYYVYDVLTSSPAHELGISAGDQLLSINRIPANLLKMDLILNIFKRNKTKPLYLVLKRDGKKIKVKLTRRKIM
jgi:hypothetical protein